VFFGHPGTIFRSYGAGPGTIFRSYGAGPGTILQRRINLLELPQYDLPELPQYDLPDLRGRQDRQGGRGRQIFADKRGLQICSGLNCETSQRDDVLRQSSYPTNSEKYLVYMPLSLVRMASHFDEANPPI